MEYRIFCQGDEVESVESEASAEMRASQIAYSRDVDEQEVVWFEKDSGLEIARYLRDANDLSYESIRDARCYGRSKDHPGAEPPSEFDDKKLTVLNYSGGKQSSCLLWMILLGYLPQPENLIVLNADPGMEDPRTYEYLDNMFSYCDQEGIDAWTVDGPDLYEDIVTLDETDKDRFDNPPYWTKDEEGSTGRLRQKCTQVYKIAPMDRAIRRVLEERFDISQKSKRLGDGIVEKWIGFSFDEVERVKPPEQKYIRFRYPLIEKGMASSDVIDFFFDHGLAVPPRSVCNACFANDLDRFQDMYENRPEAWKQAVNVDESVRDLSQIGVEDDVYVSHAAEPLKQLAENDFETTDDDENLEERSCDSGYCFI